MPMMKTSRAAVALLLASFLSTSVPIRAYAEDDPVTAQARARFKEGVDAYDKGQYEVARLAFLQAYTLKKHPSVLLNLAQSTAKAGRTLEAARYFQQFLREPGTTPQQQRDAEGGLAEVRQRLGRIAIEAPSGEEITLDDTDHLGTAPFNDAFDVEPGVHTLKSSSGQIVRVTAVAGQKVQAKFESGNSDAAAAPVASDTPETTEPPPPVHDGSKEGILSPPENMTPVYVGLAVGGVGLVSTILFAAFRASAQSKADDVANQISTAARTRNISTKGLCNDPSQQATFGQACETLRDNNSKVDTNATIANVSAVVAVAGVLTAAGWYLFAPKRGSGRGEKDSTASTKVNLTPYGGWDGGGFQLTGTF